MASAVDTSKDPLDEHGSLPVLFIPLHELIRPTKPRGQALVVGKIIRYGRGREATLNVKLRVEHPRCQQICIYSTDRVSRHLSEQVRVAPFASGAGAGFQYEDFSFAVK